MDCMERQIIKYILTSVWFAVKVRGRQGEQFHRIDIHNPGWEIHDKAGW